MIKLFCLIFNIFIFSAATFAQGVGEPIVRKPDGAILLASVSPNEEDPSERIIHTIENTRDLLAKDPTANYAIRICSADELPVAFADASGLSLAVRQITIQIESLKNSLFIEFPASNIFLLRNDKKCGLSKKMLATEYWFVPSIAELPEFVEVRNQSDVKIERLVFNFRDFDEQLLSISTSKNASLNKDYYRLVKTNLIEMLKKDKTSLLLVETPQMILKGRRNISSKAQELKTYLINQGIGRHRIFVKKNEAVYQKPNTNFYPNITIIHQK